MKRCATCKQKKHVDEFSKSKCESDGLQPRCKRCVHEYYEDNKETHKSRVRERRHGIVRENHRLMMELLQTVCCVDCGEADPVVIEFDHVRGKKRADVGELLNWALWAVVLEEIAKCDPVCANCHRRRTARRGNHYRYRSPAEVNTMTV